MQTMHLAEREKKHSFLQGNENVERKLPSSRLHQQTDRKCDEWESHYGEQSGCGGDYVMPLFVRATKGKRISPHGINSGSGTYPSDSF
jgi:hypothetical protein